MNCYYELSEQKNAITSPIFCLKLKNIQMPSNIVRKNTYDQYKNIDLAGIARSSARSGSKRIQIKKFYRIGYIIWPDTLLGEFNSGNFPSEYFINCITSLEIFDNQIINPPIGINKHLIPNFRIIPINHNKLLILDALARQGSSAYYKLDKKQCVKKALEKLSIGSDGEDCIDSYIYSEHSGAISVKNGKISDVVVSATSNRISNADPSIFLPRNDDILARHPYIFHTHPVTDAYGSRQKSGIVFDFPSPNDIFNFVTYHNTAIAQASIVVATEGMYVIRPMFYEKKIALPSAAFDKIKNGIVKIEKRAYAKYYDIIKGELSEEIYLTNIACDLSFINMFNDLIDEYNLYVEYYPRRKKKNQWAMHGIYLQNIKI